MNLRQMYFERQRLETDRHNDPAAEEILEMLDELNEKIEAEEARIAALPLEPIILNFRPEDLSQIIQSGLLHDMGFSLPTGCGAVLSVVETESPWGEDREPTRVFQVKIERIKEPS